MNGPTLEIIEGGLEREDVQALIRFHQGGMRDSSPPGLSFALDLSGLARADVTFFTLLADGTPAAIGALKALGDGSGEIKSMRVVPALAGRGYGRMILERIIAEARGRGYHRLSLETGCGPDFEAALRLYLRNGFVKGAAFADYVPTAFNHFYHLELAP